MNDLRDQVEDRRIHVALACARSRGHAPDVPREAHDQPEGARAAIRVSRWPIAALLLLGCGVLGAVFFGRSDAGPTMKTATPDPFERAVAPQELAEVTVRTRGDVEALPAATARVRGINLDVDGLEALTRLKRLQSLVLASELEPQDPVASLPDAGWEALGRLSSLQSLRIDGYEQIAPASLETLAALPILMRFELANAGELENAHIAAVRRLQSLRELRIEGRGVVDDDGIALLSELGGLRELGFAGYFAATPEGYRQIGKLARLEVLDLSAPLRLRSAGGKRFGGVATLGAAKPPAADPIDASVLREIGKLSHLRELDLAFCKSVDDAALSHLAGLEGLERIVLTACVKVTGRGLAHLSASLEVLIAGGCPLLGQDFPTKFTKLRRLELGSCATLDDGFAAWLGRLAELESVRFDTVPRISSAGWQKLAGAKKLTHLTVRGSDGIDDDVAIAWSALPELQSLNLSAIPPRFTIPEFDAQMGGRGAVTEKGVRALAALTKLEDLGLAFLQPVPVAALRDLRALRLKKLDLSYAEIAYDDETKDLEALRALWPGVELKWKQLTEDVLERAKQ